MNQQSFRRQFLTRAALLGAAAAASAGSARPQTQPSQAQLLQLGAIDGSLPEPAQLRSIALVNYGHFTTIQVQAKAARGMDFQVARLQRSTRELFNFDIPEARIRELLRHALAANEGLALVRVNTFPKRLDWMQMGKPHEPALLITQSPLAAPSHAPVNKVRTAQFERVLPHIKHVGTFGLFHFRRQAHLQGFDDTLFFDAKQSVSEGTTWNVAFHDGSRFVMPTSPALAGGAMHLLRAGMRKLKVPFVDRDVKVADLRGFRAAFLTNIPTVYQPIHRIDDVEYEFSQELHSTLQACYAANPLEAI